MPTTAFAAYRPLGGFRLFLALAVLVHHGVENLAPERWAAALRPYELGRPALLVFFALSGFVIAEAIDRLYRARPGAFMLNRLLRIVPHFVLSIALSVLVFAYLDWEGVLRLTRIDHGGALPDGAFAPGNVGLNFLGFLPLGGRQLGFNFLYIAWAVRVEIAFYILVAAALVLGLAGRWWRARGEAPPFGRTGAMLGLAALPLFVLAEAGRAPALFQFAPYFAAGWAFYTLVSRGNRMALGALLASLGAAACHLVLEERHHAALGFERAVGAQACLFVLLLAAFAVLATSRSRHPRLDRALGDVTYPFYLYHGPVLIACLSLGEGFGALLAALVGSALLAAAMTRLVDPAVNRLRDAVRGGGAPGGPYALTRYAPQSLLPSGSRR